MPAYSNKNPGLLSHTHPLKQQCSKFLSRHQPLSPAQWLSRLQASKYSQYSMDFYGEGPLVQELEERMADLLGKPKAIFCHKGMAAQLSAIKHWTQIHQNNRIAFQPNCHLDHDEQSAWRELLHLEATRIGSNEKPLATEDIHTIPSVAVVSIELPHRRAGFLLPQWQTLVELQRHCQQRSSALHFDGARLFEAAPYWQKTPKEVCELCDSVYVSVYKMFGALAGGIVAGSEDTIESIKPWKSRMSGDVHTLFPYAISAMMGLDQYLPRIQEFVDKAGHVASIVKAVFGEQSLPHAVQSNSFVVCLPLSPQETAKRALMIAEQDKKWLFDSVSATSDNQSHVEIQIGDGLDLWSDEEVTACFKRFLVE